MGEGISEECLICKVQTLPCPPTLTTNPPLQLGRNTPAAWHPSLSPAVARTTLPSLTAPPDMSFLITLQFKDPPET